MSRSYKRHLIKKDNSGSAYRRFSKNQANRLIRRTPEVPDGKAYRRFYNPWDISDWVFMYNPYPRVYYNYRLGQFEWIEPDPIYKWRMK